ncbi:MAG: dephospho-CoA kinase [Alphaproteobacteria bacterium]|nr:MAG: dephospho-CoA kinase [Alphaproteobacteria bacterium]
MTKKTPENKDSFVIGITGSIGMGKSTVSKMFEDLGIPVNNADGDVHKAMGPGGPAVEAVGKLLPAALAQDENGQDYIDRKVLAAHVFADLDDLTMLNALEKILHPIVGQLREEFVAEKSAEGHKIVICDIPLLFENGLEKDMDLTLCVSAPADVQKQRVLARPHMTEDKLESVLSRQIPDAEKRKKADIVLDTSLPIDKTREQVQQLVQDILDGKITKEQSRKSGARNGRGRGATYGADS